jgi:histidinol dehydrogenase
VDDFVKKSQFTYYTADALGAVAEQINFFANKEGLQAHGKSAMIRKE